MYSVCAIITDSKPVIHLAGLAHAIAVTTAAVTDRDSALQVLDLGHSGLFIKDAP